MQISLATTAYFCNMGGNSFGKIFSLTSFGESHGSAIGGVIDGCPPGFSISQEAIQKQLARRRPGQSTISTQRNESDQVEFLSGMMDEKTTGTPIGFLIRNKDQKSTDYDQLKDVYRPSHADFTYEAKYGIRDHRGGGRASARETIARVVAGTLAEEILKSLNVKIVAWVSQVGQQRFDSSQLSFQREQVDATLVRCPDFEAAELMLQAIEKAREEGDSLGGIITCCIEGVPAGWGEPVFDKLHADLGKAMLSINAVKGFSIGSGFEAVSMKGSEHNDEFITTEKGISTLTNHSGGIQGGISNGQPIWFQVAFKPVASISKTQQTVTRDGLAQSLDIKGRHDPCVVPRAVPIVESMAALVLIDHWLRTRAINQA
jgi:chorismate synthase